MIRLENVSKSFGSRSLFSNLNLVLEPGKVYALIGASGSGKTTLLNIMGKLETYDGDIVYCGKNFSRIRNQDYFRFELGYLFQNFGLIEDATIAENLKLGMIGQNLTKKEIILKQKEALTSVGLSYLKLDQKIYELSGGESQRIALAKLILKEPAIILADEPTASIDPQTAKLIMEILLSMRKEDRVIVLATHNPIIWEMADEVISMDNLIS